MSHGRMETYTSSCIAECRLSKLGRSRDCLPFDQLAESLPVAHIGLYMLCIPSLGDWAVCIIHTFFGADRLIAGRSSIFGITCFPLICMQGGTGKNMYMGCQSG